MLLLSLSKYPILNKKSSNKLLFVSTKYLASDNFVFISLLLNSMNKNIASCSTMNDNFSSNTFNLCKLSLLYLFNSFNEDSKDTNKFPND